MKKRFWLILVLVLACIFSIGKYVQSEKVAELSTTPIPTPTPPLPVASKTTTSLFVPYWSVVSSLPSTYDRLIYFGITPTLNGVNTEEVGYQDLPRFVAASAQVKHRYLTLRMLDNTQNFAILKDPTAQGKVIAKTVSVATSNGFDGIVLDLELKALPFDSLLKQVNSFTSVFYKKAKEQRLSFAITQYGDTFYRVRPFDVPTIGKNADEVMIMAYDFHKAGGDPGPSFPLNGQDKYGYDFKEMIDAFSQAIPRQKLTVIFGYFGYDWPTDEKGKAINTAASFSLSDIHKQYLDNCPSCVVARDSESAETKITYISDDHIHHTVWFEDEDSVRAKQEFLRSQGIMSYSYWAYSYF